MSAELNVDIEPIVREQENPDIRHDWSREEIVALFELPFADLMFRAQSMHRKYHDPNEVQLSTLLSIKTGACPEDCKYCPQSARYNTEVGVERLMPVETVIREAQKAKAAGATRFCMGAAWRSPKGRNFETILGMVRAVKDLGMEACVTAGMIDSEQAVRLKEAGLDYYNHNIDTSPEYYSQVITTRNIGDRLNTLQAVDDAGLKMCSGGIVGLGEDVSDRAGMLQTLANMDTHPQSVPINMLVQVEGTPMYGEQEVDPIDFVRTVAVARIVMPLSTVRLSAGRQQMSEEMQAMCFLAGAGSIFYGEKLLTTPNPEESDDFKLLNKLGIHPRPANHQDIHFAEDSLS